MNGLSDKANLLKLEYQFTDGETGQTRVLEGCFLYAEGGTRKDDASEAVLPWLIARIWNGGTKDYKLEPISPSAMKLDGKGDDVALDIYFGRNSSTKLPGFAPGNGSNAALLSGCRRRANSSTSSIRYGCNS